MPDLSDKGTGNQNISIIATKKKASLAEASAATAQQAREAAASLINAGFARQLT